MQSNISIKSITDESAATFLKRWHSFEEMWKLADLRWKQLDEKCPPNLPFREKLSVDTLRTLLDHLYEFGNAHFKFFLNGFTGKLTIPFQHVGAEVTLKDSSRLFEDKFQSLRSNYSIGEHVLSEILDRAVFDLQVIDQAIDQRIMAATTDKCNTKEWNVDQVTEEINCENLDLYQTITKADQLARNLMKMFGQSLDGSANAITYLRTAPSMRVTPYADVALIGLPVSVLGNDADLLAIPHEIGHFLFWNEKRDSEGNQIPFQKYLKENLKCLEKDPSEIHEDQLKLPWIEEIVADIVSTLVGGPITTYTLMQRLQTAVGKSFTFDDGEHPIPAIRPYICFKVMETRTEYADMAEALKREWEKILQSRGADLTTKQYKGRKFSELIDPEGEFLLQVAELSILVSSELVQKDPLWLVARDDSNTIEFSKLVTNFIEKVRNIADIGRGATPHPPISWLGRMKELFEPPIPLWLQNWQPGSESVVISDGSIEPVGNHKETVIPAIEWLTVFEAGGWTTGGDGPGHLKDSSKI